MRILIFGGLTAVGVSITDYFLQEGIETCVVKSSVFNEFEEEQELFFGRHALYQAIDSESEFESELSIDTVCFAGHFDERKETTRSDLLNHLKRVLSRERKVETVILLSHAVVGTSDEMARGAASEKAYFEEIECLATTLFESREDNGKRRLLILRLPNLTNKENNILSIDSYEEQIDRNEMAKRVFELTKCDYENGVHYFHLVRNQDQESTKRGEWESQLVEENQSLSSNETKK